ncbi:MAG: sulfur carrier protein ThiS [Stenotrophomonas sp.]
MLIQLNGSARQIRAPLTLAALLIDEGLAQRRVAVEINGDIVPRSQHGERLLAEGDVVEIVHALGGG